MQPIIKQINNRLVGYLMTGLITDLKVNNRPTRLWTCPGKVTTKGGLEDLELHDKSWSEYLDLGQSRHHSEIPVYGMYNKRGPTIYYTFCIRLEWITLRPRMCYHVLLFKIWCAHGWRYDDVIHLTSSFPSSGFRINHIITITCLWLTDIHQQSTKLLFSSINCH
jgi:hypothetical protein